MVHRPADSRLLVNLLNHEKEYSKQLANLLNHSQSSLTSFSAYASASTPPTSQIIVSVAGALFGADEALRKYSVTVDQWQHQLKTLKEMEDAIANIIRDREILVARLLKASKHSKPNREAIPIPNSSSSNLSFNGINLPEVQVGSKVSAAQTELQACEAHLANKEKELEAFRAAAIRSGLQARCKALVECGWTWGELGKEGLRALDMFDASIGNGCLVPPPLQLNTKTLPELGQERRSSDHSSIAPSQSASQIITFELPRTAPPVPNLNLTQYTLSIPPAHTISESVMPTAFYPHPQEADEPGGSSAEEGDQHREVEVVENERFLPSRKGKGPVRAHVRTISEAEHNRHVHFPSSTSDTFLLRSPTGRESDKGKRGGSVRKGSHGVFGSIAALFRGHKSGGSVDGESPTSPVTPIAKEGKWKTRIDKNLKKAAKGDDSSDDEDRRRHKLRSMGPSVSAPHIQEEIPVAGPGPETARARRRLKHGSLQVPPQSEYVVPPEERGWMSEGEGPSVRGKIRKLDNAIHLSENNPGPSKRSSTLPLPPRQDSIAKTPNGDVAPVSRTSSLKKTRPKVPNGGLQLVASTPAEAPLYRSTSLSRQNVMPAPAEPSQRPTISAYNAVPVSSSPRRVASASQPSTSKSVPFINPDSGKVLSGAGYPPMPNPTANKARKNVLRKRPGETSMSALMSIVEDARKNREMYVQQQDPNRLLVMPKAPPPASELLELEQQKERDAKQAEDNLKSIAAAAANAVTEPPLPTTPTLPVPTERETVPVKVVLHTPPGKNNPPKPLRSALRNASPSPSPSPSQSPPLGPVAGPSKLRTITSLPPLPLQINVATQIQKPPPEKSPVMNDGNDEDHSDSSSVASYATGLEVLAEEGGSRGISPTPPLPPPRDEPKPQAQGAVTSDVSQSTDSTTPRRTKSVRMSLPPKVSATPPAIYEDNSGDGDVTRSGSNQHELWSAPAKRRSRHTPSQTHHTPVPGAEHSRSNGWSTRIPDHPTFKEVWEDSSDEDEEYGKARKLLSMFSRK